MYDTFIALKKQHLIYLISVRWHENDWTRACNDIALECTVCCIINKLVSTQNPSFFFPPFSLRTTTNNISNRLETASKQQTANTFISKESESMIQYEKCGKMPCSLKILRQHKYLFGCSVSLWKTIWLFSCCWHRHWWFQQVTYTGNYVVSYTCANFSFLGRITLVPT